MTRYSRKATRRSGRIAAFSSMRRPTRRWSSHVMPLYEYECDACRKRFEAIRKFSESDLDVCSLCGKGPVRRLISSPAIQFKGTGWYITDYSKKSGTDAGQTGGGTSGNSDKS